MHTTASDGRLAPAELVARVVAAGLTTISVTDHDTVMAIAETRRHALLQGVTVISGIEVTAVHDSRDVHILGYFFDEDHRPFASFLERQRAQRVERVRAIAERLAALGCPIDVEAIIWSAARSPGVALGRPRVAQALVEGGFVESVQQAFDRYLAAGQPAYVPRLGASPTTVVDAIHAAGGVASLAHPGVTQQPALVGPLAAHGLDAIEVYHSDHTPAMQRDALAAARRFDLAISGGSDHHGEPVRRPLGAVTLPPPEFERLQARAQK